MKTVSGAVVSSKPVSLSKAAKILSKFALADNGASPAYIAYLKRASDSFDELVHFHKELRGSGSERKSKKDRSGNHLVEKPEEKDEVGLVNGHDPKKKKKMKEIRGKIDSENVDDSQEIRKIRKELKKEMKKIKKEAIEEGRSNGTVEAQGNVGEVKVEGENGGKKGKKRKNEEIADESDKQVHKKKKKKGRNESDA